MPAREKEMPNQIRIAMILAGGLLVAAPAYALPSQASAGQTPAFIHSSQIAESNINSFAVQAGGPNGPGREQNASSPEDVFNGSEFGQSQKQHDAPPPMPWSGLGDQRGPVVFDGEHGGGKENRGNHLPDSPHGCSPDKPGCTFILSATPSILPAIPEAETYVLMLTGLLAMGLLRRLRKNRR